MTPVRVSRPTPATGSFFLFFFGLRLFFLPFFYLAVFQSKLTIAGELTPIVSCDWKWIPKHSASYHLHITANRSIGGVFPITQLNSEQPHEFTGGSERPHHAGRGRAPQWGRGGRGRKRFKQRSKQQDNSQGCWVLQEHKLNMKQREFMHISAKGQNSNSWICKGLQQKKILEWDDEGRRSKDALEKKNSVL